MFILELYAGSSSYCYKKCFQQVVLFGRRHLNFELSSVSSCLGSKLPSTRGDFCLNNTHNKCYQSQIKLQISRHLDEIRRAAVDTTNRGLYIIRYSD